MRIRSLIRPALFLIAGFLLFFTSSKVNAQVYKIAPITVDPTTEVRKNEVKSADLKWATVVNNSYQMPGTTATFSSYGQPSVNTRGKVVFRARSTGGQRQTGIYTRQFPQAAITPMMDLNTVVPYPNNLNTMFTEFPSIPRISFSKSFVASRGTHSPVYLYMLPDETETRVGTTGLYVDLGSGTPTTGASKVGLAPGFKYFMVPGPWNIVFDVFPGSPAINDMGTLVFKGNFTVDGVGKTGIFFRNVLDTPGGGNDPLGMIASSDTVIPNGPPTKGLWPLKFESTAPPTVVDNDVVFVGLDNEDFPNYGGIYIAPLENKATLRLLIGIGSQISGTDLPPITRVGEALAFDGRYLAFWGAWGRDTKTIRLYCPEDGNPDLLAFCNGVDPLSVYDPQTRRWYQEKQVEVNQGIFLYDVYSNYGYLVAGTKGDYNDFIYWGYSGKAPGTGSGGDEDAEPPRWRAAAFVATSNGKVVFKARTGLLDGNNVYVDPIDGLYMGEPISNAPLSVLVETGMDGGVIDPSIAGMAMPVTGLGIEREGFRGHNLVMTATMANAEESWGGVYFANIPGNGPGKAPVTVKKKDLSFSKLQK